MSAALSLKLTKSFVEALPQEDKQAITKASFADFALYTPNQSIQVVSLQLTQAIGLKAKQAATIQLIIENVLEAKTEYIAIPLGYESYQNQGRGFSITNKAMTKALGLLTEQGYITLYKGSQFSELCTRIAPTSKLRLLINILKGIKLKRRAAPLVVIKDENKKIIKPTKEQKAEVVKLAANVKLINKSLSKHKFTYNQAEYRVAYKRVFNNSSLLDGGRFYSTSFQNIGQAERAKILIDGESVAEVDFKCLHPNLLYVQKTGKAFEGDAYNVPNTKRDDVKIAFQLVLNTNSKTAAIASLRGKGVEDAEAVINALEVKHSAIAGAFYKGVGVKLQAIDSTLAESIMLYAELEGVPLICIHDSFVCRASDEQWLRNVMSIQAYMLLDVELPLK